MFIKRYSCLIFLQHIHSVIFLRIQEIHEHRQAIYMLCVKYWTHSYLLCQVDESVAVICLLDRNPWYPNLKNMFITSGQIVILLKSFRVRFLQSSNWWSECLQPSSDVCSSLGNVLLNGKKNKNPNKTK